MEWIWDNEKAAGNLAKHGIGFDAAVLVFDDPWHLSEPDPHPDDDRWRTIGMVDSETLFVVHTLIEPDGNGRIISARLASRMERRRYEEGSH